MDADGIVRTPVGIAADGTPIYRRFVPQGFLLVVEAKPGPSGFPVGLSTFNWMPGDVNAVPDLQIVTARDLGTGAGKGSTDVCDNEAGYLGGVPAVDPPVFTGTQFVADAVNDFACRFSPRSNPIDACTVDAERSSAFAGHGTKVQFCSVPAVGAEIAFPLGDTRLTVRVRDTAGNPGFPASVIIRVQ